jgi:hypothetical protein
MAGLGLDHWWEEPHYKQSSTPNERGEFILGKLMQRDPKKVQTLLREICQMEGFPSIAETETVTSAQWRIILEAMGANPVEVAEVLTRMRLEHEPP